MKKSLFTGTGRFYKANLHNHTVVSDGHETPAEIKSIYQAQNYDVIAYSDHDIMVPHGDLTDDRFLALTAFEYEFTEDLAEGVPYEFRRTYHCVLIAPRQDMDEYPWANPSYAWGNALKHIQPYYKGDKPHRYLVEDVNAMIEDAHRLGYIVTYCHPQWSTQHFPDYAGIENVDYVETYNAGCYVEGYELDACDYVMNDFLWMGKRVAPTASDDGHNFTNYCGGATYIKAESLNYDDIFAALKRKDVYASWGPEIKDIAFDPETGELSIDCSDARDIFLSTERRHSERKHSTSGFPINHASFDLKEYLENTVNYSDPSKCFVRLTVVDAAGRKALSRGYFADELLQK